MFIELSGEQYNGIMKGLAAGARKSDDKPALMGAFMEVENGETVRFTALDGSILVHYRLHHSTPQQGPNQPTPGGWGCIMPIMPIKAKRGEMVRITVDGAFGEAGFNATGVTVENLYSGHSLRQPVYGGNYVDYRKLAPKDDGTREYTFVDAEKLCRALQGMLALIKNNKGETTVKLCMATGQNNKLKPITFQATALYDEILCSSLVLPIKVEKEQEDLWGFPLW